MPELGENIKKKRLDAKLSQQQLADALGYKTRSSIAKIEKGETDVTQSKLRAIANALNTTVQYLNTGIDESTNNKNIVVPHTEIPESSNESTDLNSPEYHRQNQERVAVVVLAGGQSTRNQQNAPNQFISVNGKPVIIYTLEAYQRHPAIDEIYIVCLSGWESIIPAYARQYKITKLAGIIPAGKTGALSVKAAVEWLSTKYSYNDIVIFQEATRPMVTEEMISNVIHCTNRNGSAITYEPMNEYLQFMEFTGQGVEYIDRSKLISIQSPEAYRFGKLHRTFINANKINHPFDETCCAMVMYNLGSKLVFCEGNRFNLKIVRQEDLEFFRALLSSRNSS